MDQNKHSIANFAALKTAIVNSEEELLKELLSKIPMQELEMRLLAPQSLFEKIV
ncbi:hypothetical protein [Colwellia sp. PAMC 20917]|uniref:hypothetical protein n=1 Tax=Colwellia sp. PAMC 20917 TaxID=1816218 RepID=UPI000ADEA660|nr:hypothetical protein [Colwellia sp. PAMC 20917]